MEICYNISYRESGRNVLNIRVATMLYFVLFQFDVLPAVNTATHKTALYAGDQVVIRRGGKFHVCFSLNQEFDKTKHALNVEFRRGTTPDFQRGTHFECVVGCRAVCEWEWWGSVEGTQGNTVDVVVNIPVNTPVGEYEVIAEAVDQRNGKQEDCGADKKVVILFNPFDKGEHSRLVVPLNVCTYVWPFTSLNVCVGGVYLCAKTLQFILELMTRANMPSAGLSASGNGGGVSRGRRAILWMLW